MVNYQNPYLYGFTPQIQPTQVIRVNGENGARAYNLGPNSSALLLDESGLIVWLATTDGAGYKTVSAYDITPHKIAQAPDLGSLENRIKRLEDIISDTADTTATRRRNDNPSADPANDEHGSEIRRSSANDGSSYQDEPENQRGYGYRGGVRK